MVPAETVVGQSRNLMRAFSKYAELMPRAYKFTHGDRIISRSIMVLDCVVEASNSGDSDKPALIEKATNHLDKLREIMQGCLEDGIHDRSRHERYIGEIDAVGKTLGGWSESVSGLKR
jgi:hypothetical protein